MDKTKAIISKIQKHTAAVSEIELRLDETIRDTYTTPGQYTIVTLPQQKDGYFAFCQRPNLDTWALLIKNSSPLTDEILNLKEGDSLTVSQAQGNGYPLNEIIHKDVLLFAAGTGITPIRAFIQEVMKDRYRYGRMTLLYGVRKPEEFYFCHEFETLKRNNIQIIQTISLKNSKSWTGLMGYVQHHIPQEINLEKTVSLVSGPNAMIVDVKSVLKNSGFKEDQLLTNF